MAAASHQPPGVIQRGVRPLLVLLVILVALLAAATAAEARFTKSKSVAGNTFNTDTLNPPTGVGASGGVSAMLNWTPTVDANADGHKVYRSTTPGGPYSQIAQVTPRAAATYIDSPSSGTYYYVLRAFDQSWESLNSSQVSAIVNTSWLATGSYTGNGADNRAIIGVGFQPDIVIIKCDCGQDAVVRTGTMAGDASKQISTLTALQADHVQSLDADGFTIGTSLRVNGSTNVYHWTAMRAGTNVKVGSYVGNGADDRNISGVGFQPVWVMTMGDGADSIFRPGTAVGDVSFSVDGSAQVANRIQAIQSDGFQIGTNAAINAAGVTYHYVAWKANAAAVVQTTYIGDGLDNRDITGVGFQPLFLWVKRDTTNVSSWRSATLSGDKAFSWIGVTSANEIQALQADGFQVGSNAKVNTSGATHHYLALKDTP